MRLRSLDGLRGLGAILVALGHLEIAGLVELGDWMPRSHVLIDFFFVLSGFVIALHYADALTDGRSAADFVIRRVGRIWPLHAVILTAFLAVELVKAGAVDLTGFSPHYQPFTGQRPADMILPTYAMLHAFGLDDQLTWNFPSWSVAAEFWTYILFALVAFGTAGRPVLRNLIAGAVVLIAGAAIVLWSPHRMNATYDFGFVRAAFGFFAGLLLAAAWNTGRLSAVRGTGFELAAAALGVVFVGWAYGTPFEFAAPIVFVLLTLVFAADAGRLSAILSCRPLDLAGRWSYSIYLVHAFVLTVAMPRVFTVIAAHVEDHRLGSLLMVAIYLPLVIAISAATYAFVEVPGQKAAARLAKRWAARRPAAPAPLAAAAG